MGRTLGQVNSLMADTVLMKKNKSEKNKEVWIKNITKKYGDVMAVDSVSLHLKQSEFVSLCENGEMDTITK